MAVSATSSPVVLLTNAVEPAKAAAPATANPNGDGGASEFQQLLAQAAEEGRATAGVVLLTDKAALQSAANAKEQAGGDGNVLPLLTDLLPLEPIAATSTDGDTAVEAGSVKHKSSDDDKAAQTDLSDKADQAVTLLVTPPVLPVLPPAPAVPTNAASVPTPAATDEAQAVALSGVQLAAQLPKGDSVVGDVKSEAESGAKDDATGDAKAAAKRAIAANSGDALAIAATTTTKTAATTAAIDPAMLNSASGDGASAKGDSNNADFAGLLKQLDATAAQPSGSIDSGRTVQQAERAYQQQTTPATATVSLPMASDGWHDAVADKVMWFSANKITSAEIHLNPPDLGPIQVHISTDHDQASVYFTSQHASVREALDQALPRLRDMMGGQGIQLANAGVGGQGSSPQQQDYRGNSDGRSRAPADSFLRDLDDGAEPIGVSSVATARLTRSGIDAYA